MPTTTNDGTELYYRSEGDGECVAFVGECGFGAWQWAWLYDELAGPYETLAWDLRGTGRSDAPEGPYTVDQLASDFEAVLAANSVRRVHVVGAGLGGMVALRYAREYGRAVTLSVCNTAPDGSGVALDALEALFPESSEDSAMKTSLRGAFSTAFLERATESVQQICEWRRQEDAASPARAAQIDALRSFEAGPLYELTVPALVCHGVDNPVVPRETGEALAETLPRGQFQAIEGKHLAYVEHARALADRLDGFIADHA